MSHFSDQEFNCRCDRSECDAPRKPHRLLLLYLSKARELYGEPMVVTSGNRCAFWNGQNGGVHDSEHSNPGGCLGADISCVTSVSRWRMLDAFRHAGITRIGVYKKHLHVGVGDIVTGAPAPVVWVG